ncbi:HEAT domain containing protein [Emticicia oligotrophica DSM 17448]|uniref:HEAT domain containing protein n=1 Tax=Emticicia oligotrophica (strain DSM 17448 / CIP 109782 / MTCC 6937 / GPTSA100-15) TaxID=929562 RepID=A0ABM5N2Z3_EMTOG|nr:HEAT repeat domain-containing protein [Emticicia oligotrophica]AFK03673.1 HEAT domain containing protein [Emticicia oligotrophica DSM 17448]
MNEQFDDIEKSLWEQLGRLQTPEPSRDMKPSFHAMLETYKAEVEEKKANSWTKRFTDLQQIFTYKPAYNWAYGLVILVVGVSIGYFSGKPNSTVTSSQEDVKKLSSEVQEMKEMMMLSMLENPTATERLKAVSYTQELPKVDDKIIDALLTTLNSDPNENVRLVTLEALVQLADNPKVREGLVQSLMKQESPLVQVALADAMVKLQEKRSIKQFKQLLQKENLNEAVKGKIEQTIQVLS